MPSNRGWIMRIWLLAASAILVTTTVSQEIKHAPTLQSCIGDINLWSSQIPGFPEPSVDQLRAGTKSLTMHEMDGRTASLAECSSAYPQLGKPQSGDLPANVTLLMYYDDEQNMRYSDFLLRHGMLEKFKEEDNAGRR
jgi:hypothetical protein